MGVLNPLVIYHANCWDGFCCAWLLSKAFPEAEFLAAHYGTEPPPAAGRDVIIADFSYKRPVLTEMAKAARSITVLDHHKTAQADLADLNLPGLSITFDMTKSGGRLTWEYLFSRGLLDRWDDQQHLVHMPTIAPWIVDYTEDRDLWRHALYCSREINAALRSYPLDFAVWDTLHERGVYEHGKVELANEGRAILRSESQIVQSHVKHAREITLDGHKVLSVNATVLFSEIAGELATGRPFGICYFDRSDGKRQYSLRSREGGIDVSEIAKKHGGGGHPQAAGFEEIAR